MTLPFTMANRFVRPRVIEVTRNAEDAISGPECSVAVASLVRAAGFHPIGQNGLRVFSGANVDLFLNSRAAGAGASAAWAEPAATHMRRITRKVFISFG